jgi:hypothetical protein
VVWDGWHNNHPADWRPLVACGTQFRYLLSELTHVEALRCGENVTFPANKPRFTQPESRVHSRISRILPRNWADASFWRIRVPVPSHSNSIERKS